MNKIVAFFVPIEPFSSILSPGLEILDNGIPWKWADLAPFSRNTIIDGTMRIRPKVLASRVL